MMMRKKPSNSPRTREPSRRPNAAEATDGSIGKVDKHSGDVGASHLVADTGVWIFGKHALIPVGLVSGIDTAAETIYVNRTKEQIKNAPEFDKDKHAEDAGYHEQFGGYYGSHRA
ncbi:PRC-barrel domain containing protein [Streptomyces sp. R11]|uniref:PRC-barrel domain containing protein n=1 Tax=Streptomyces sp. R11 TaxID=3238625 RepID=A0AB39MPR7_9ACTN